MLNKNIEENNKFIIGNYSRYPISIIRGEGSYVYDSNNKKYLDFISGIAVNNLGHSNEGIKKAIIEQLDKLVHISNLFLIPSQIKLAKSLTSNLPRYKVFFCNSGTEANEAAFKLARKWGIFNNKKTIISVTGGFHGRTFGSLSATTPKKYKEGFYPLVPGFKTAKFNDINSIKSIIKEDKKILAVIIEPIQGEAGVKISDKKYLQELFKICKKNKILLIADEVQVGIGRTGKLFGFENYDIKPDIITLAKALGGGIPCGAIIANPDISDFLTPGSHGTTMGGNPLAMASGLSMLNQIKKPSFLNNVNKKGELFLDKLKKLSSSDLIKEVRGKGLILAIEFYEEKKARLFVNKCIKNGLLVLITEKYNVRILPPLNVKNNEIIESIKIMKLVLEQINE
ncbi:MAG: aspartate aminotransferase family protein [Thermodesulfobacteriota bacterium]|nr:aspartate aminotransferase family protein [Thermodesulfobacteriota bacterium]